jgi:cell division protein FtsB
MTAQTFKSSNARRPRSKSRKRPEQKFQPEHKWLVWEILFKLGLNGVFVVVSIMAIARLLPHQQAQQAKLNEIQMQVEETEARVEQLRNDFQRSFDPGQSRKIMEELSPRHDPNQRKIILTEPKAP